MKKNVLEARPGDLLRNLRPGGGGITLEGTPGDPSARYDGDYDQLSPNMGLVVEYDEDGLDGRGTCWCVLHLPNGERSWWTTACFARNWVVEKEREDADA